MNPTILMINGKYFNFTDPDSAEYDIYVIAHALSNVCRFAGHTVDYYSVAQHSVLVSRIVPPEYALMGLLHDAPEAFIHDITKPLKIILSDYQAIEKRVEKSVFKHFHLPPKLHPEIKKADLIALQTERRDLMPAAPSKEWERLKGVEPWPEIINPWAPRSAQGEFMLRYKELTATPRA